MSYNRDILFGRNEELTKLLNAWISGKRIYGIAGMKMIGKSTLMEEFVHKIQKLEALSLVKIDFRTVKTIEDLKETLCEIFKIDTNNFRLFEDEDGKYIALCDRLLQKIDRENAKRRKIVFILDNLETTLAKTDNDNSGKRTGILHECFWDKLWKYIFNRLLDSRANTFIVFSATESLKFAQKRSVFISVNVLHLDDFASFELVKSEWPNIPDHDVSKILKCCKGHPQAIINLVLMLKEVRGILLSTDEVFQQLKDRELDLISDTFLPSTDKVDINIVKTIERLSSDDRRNLCKLVELTKNMSQSMEVLTIMFGYEKEVAKFKFDVLRPLHGRCLLEIDMETKLLCCNHLVSKTILEHFQHDIDYRDSADAVVREIHSIVRENKIKKVPTEHVSEKDTNVIIGARVNHNQKYIGYNDTASHDRRMELSINYESEKYFKLKEQLEEENYCPDFSQAQNLCGHEGMKFEHDKSVKSFTPSNDLDIPAVEQIQTGADVSLEENYLYTSQITYQDQRNGKSDVNKNKNDSGNSENEEVSGAFPCQQAEYVEKSCLSGRTGCSSKSREVDYRRNNIESKSNKKTGSVSIFTTDLNENRVVNYDNEHTSFSGSPLVDENCNVDSVVEYEHKGNVNGCRNKTICQSNSVVSVDLIESHQTNKENQYSMSCSENRAVGGKQQSNNLFTGNIVKSGSENMVFLDEVKQYPLTLVENHDPREEKVTSTEKPRFDTVTSGRQYTCLRSSNQVSTKHQVRSRLQLDQSRNNGQILRSEKPLSSTLDSSPEDNLTQSPEVYYRLQTPQYDRSIQTSQYDTSIPQRMSPLVHVYHGDIDVIQKQLCNNSRNENTEEIQRVSDEPIQIAECSFDSRCFSGLDLL